MDKVREEFEEWARKMSMDLEYRNIPGVGQFYECQRTLLALEAWKSSRESLVIELPSKISQCNTSPSGYVRPEAEHYDEAIDDCREAIHAAGVRTK